MDISLRMDNYILPGVWTKRDWVITRFVHAGTMDVKAGMLLLLLRTFTGTVSSLGKELQKERHKHVANSSSHLVGYA